MKIGRAIVRQSAQKHIAFDDGSFASASNIQDYFVCPPLSERQQERTEAIDAATDGGAPRESIDQILKSPENYIFLGKRETGKTSLLHFFAARLAEGASGQSVIPVVVDFKNLRRGTNVLGRAVRSYYQDLPAGYEPLTLIEKYGAVFLVDNYDPESEASASALSTLIATNPKIRWICFADDQTKVPNFLGNSIEDGIKIKKLYILSLPRNSIRQLSRNWSVIGSVDADSAYETVISQINRANLPRTGYIASLLLWAIHKHKNFDQVNEATLLQNIVEHLLEKTDFKSFLRKEFDFRSKEILLQALAKFFRQLADGSAAKNSVLEFIIGFFKDQKLDFDAAKILDGFIACGILNEYDEFVSFKYRFFQEYFLAGLFSSTPSEVDAIFERGDVTAYARELDFMSGLSRKEVSLLSRVENLLNSTMDADIQRANPKDLEKLTVGASSAERSQARAREIQTKKLSAEHIDDLLDRAEKRTAARRAKISGKRRSPETDNAAQYLMLLDLYGRLIRNCEFVPGDVKDNHVRRFLDKWASICTFVTNDARQLISEAKELQDETPLFSDREIEELVSFLATVLPVACSLAQADEIGTPKLAQVFSEIAVDEKAALIVRLFSAFIAMDLRIDKWEMLWRKILFEEKSVNSYWLTLAIDRLYAHYVTRYLAPEQRQKFENLLADIKVRLEGLPAAAKGPIVTSLRRRRLTKDTT